MQERDFQDNVSTTSTDVPETSVRTDKSETEEEMDPWIPLIEEAKQRRNVALEEMKESLINTGLDEQSAKDKAFSNVHACCLNSRRNRTIFIWSVSCGRDN
jgi:hypothetical protein